MDFFQLDVFAEADQAPVEEPIALSAAAGNVALEKAATRAGRRKAAAQASLFDLANQKVIDDLRNASEALTGDEARELIRKLKDQLI